MFFWAQCIYRMRFLCSSASSAVSSWWKCVSWSHGADLCWQLLIGLAATISVPASKLAGVKSTPSTVGNALHLSVCAAVLGGVCAVCLLVTTTGLFLHSPPQLVAKWQEPGPWHSGASGAQHLDTARQRPPLNPNLPAGWRKPAADAVYRFLHLPAAQAAGVWPQLHAAGTFCSFALSAR